MNKILTPTLLLTLLCTIAYTQNFSGKIAYSNTFTDLNNKDITAQMASFFGKETHYFINDNNYKAYDQNNRLLYLYNASSNVYYSSTSGKNNISQTDAGKPTGEKPEIKMLPGKTTISGYECASLEMKTPSGNTTYFFSPGVQINKNNFQHHHFGNWNAYLKASNGALPLKFIYTDTKNGFIWTCVAKGVESRHLKETDFDIEIEKKSSSQSVAAPMADWLVYEGNGWTANFPSDPEESQKTIPTAIGEQTMHIYMYTEPNQQVADNIVYAAIQTIFPDTLVSSAKTEMIDPLMRNSIDGAVKNVQGQLLSESVISLGEFPGREVKISFQQGAGIINLRIYLVKNTLYMLQAICEKSKDDNASAKRFMHSFKLQ